MRINFCQWDIVDRKSMGGTDERHGWIAAPGFPMSELVFQSFTVYRSTERVLIDGSFAPSDAAPARLFLFIGREVRRGLNDGN